MSFKKRIYTIVWILALVSFVIGIVSIYAMRNIYRAMEEEATMAMRVSQLKDIRSEMQNVLIAVREIVISKDVESMKREKANLDKLVGAYIDPQFRNFAVTQQEQPTWDTLAAQWEKHKDIVERIYANAIMNSDFFATTLSIGASLEYWQSYNEPLRKIVELAKAGNTDADRKLESVAWEALESLKSLQLQEKLVVLSPDAARRSRESDVGKAELSRFSKILNIMERMLTNPGVTDAELKSFNAAFSQASAGKIQFRDEGGITSRTTAFTLPADFMPAELADAAAVYWRQIKPARGGGTEIFNKVFEIANQDSTGQAFAILINECNPTRIEETRLIGDLVKMEEDALQEAVQVAGEDYSQAFWIVIIVGVVGLVIGLALSIVSVTSINSALDSTISELTTRSDDVERISRQLADGSESLAEGANEQAASLEETSSALEEMASMTRQNADNANQTKKTADNSLSLITNGARTLDTVTTAMAEITDSSEKISAIIKTIEEIAFQTNLLALNAAVEAARAGEAGKGFAVVADEVRSLAGRSAQAAKDTSELIVGTVARVRNGSENVSLLARAFKDIESESQSVGRLVKEITAASNEQAQGVDQVNTAVAQMDKVTQTNAATAHESSGAASELSQQSANLNALVGNLAALVYGRNGSARRDGRPSSSGTPPRHAALSGPRVMRPTDIMTDDFE